MHSIRRHVYNHSTLILAMKEQKRQEKNKVVCSHELNNLIREIVDETGFRLGSPWRPNGSLSVVVPILSNSATTIRKYLTHQEATRLKIVDSGSIGGLLVSSTEDLPVFLRLGSVLNGVDTQSRSVNKSIFILPSETVDIAVNCVHASHGIIRGSRLMSAPNIAAPASIEDALIRSDQREVWTRVRCYSANRSGRTPLSDSLVEELNRQDGFARRVQEILQEVPEYEGQVGLVVFDEVGLLGLEMFDSPKSWNALGRSIVSKFAEVLVKRANENILRIEVNETMIKDLVIKFLRNLESGRKVKNLERKSTIINVRGKVNGEAAFLDSEFVHLTAVRNDDLDAAVRGDVMSGRRR